MSNLILAPPAAAPLVKPWFSKMVKVWKRVSGAIPSGGAHTKWQQKKVMSKTTVRVVARIVALPSHLEEVKSILTDLIEPTRQESGCIQYKLLQNQEYPTDFVFVEEWENEALLNAHLDSPHINSVDAKLDGLLAAEPDIRFYRLLA